MFGSLSWHETDTCLVVIGNTWVSKACAIVLALMSFFAGFAPYRGNPSWAFFFFFRPAFVVFGGGLVWVAYRHPGRSKATFSRVAGTLDIELETLSGGRQSFELAEIVEVVLETEQGFNDESLFYLSIGLAGGQRVRITSSNTIDRKRAELLQASICRFLGIAGA